MVAGAVENGQNIGPFWWLGVSGPNRGTRNRLGSRDDDAKLAKLSMGGKAGRDFGYKYDDFDSDLTWRGVAVPDQPIRPKFGNG